MEFNVESGDDGRTKAVAVTGPGGAAPLVRTHACAETSPPDRLLHLLIGPSRCKFLA